MIRIMLADDHAMLREALRVILEQDKSMKVVAEVGDGETALNRADEMLPDVVVMDIAMPGLSGIETTRRLIAKHPNIRVLALSTYLDRSIILQMLEAGALGYIVKSAAATELKQGIRRVVEKHIYLCTEVAALISDTLRETQMQSRKPAKRNLSGRELQVAALLAEGKTAPEIAAQINISAGTVNVHRRNLMNKLGVHNVVELTRYAIRTGLILS